MESTIIKDKKGLSVPERPVIPYIEGDGTGPDIWKAAVDVFEAAVEKSYGKKRKVSWMEVLAGEKGFKETGEWLPEATLEAFNTYLVGIKGPLTTPVGGGFRSLNVTLRQKLNLFVCQRPVRYYPGIPSPVKNPSAVDMVVFRENTEDVYAGFETPAGKPETTKLIDVLNREFGWKIKEDSGIGIKPVSRSATKRLVRAAMQYALDHNRRSLTLVHKGNIMKYTEGAFREWGYALLDEEFSDTIVRWEECKDGKVPEGKVLIKDAIADAFLQQVLTRPKEFDVIATMNLNGDYISDALAAQVGGIGIAPGANINYETGHALFEATHGTAPKYAGKNMVNPSSLILSGGMLFDYLGWTEASEKIERGMTNAIKAKRVTYDFARLMEDAEKINTTDFGKEIIARMED